MKFLSLCSGSKGNCSLVINDDCTIMIDCGASFKYIKQRLSELNISIEEIDYLFITHQHIDHVRSIKSFKEVKKYSCANIEGTIKLNFFNPIEIKGVQVTALPLSHDSENTSGYLFECDYKKLAYITDTGYVSKQIYPHIHNADYFFIESNHDIEMLMKTNRPYMLKSRIISDTGHLCNEDCMNLLSRVIGPSTKEIILAHLSEEANTRQIAYDVTHSMIKNHPYYSKIKVSVAPQFEICRGGSWDEENTDHDNCIFDCLDNVS